MAKYLINASNLHVGGGVQVATSFIGELSLMDSLPPSLVVWASETVDKNLRQLGYNLAALPAYEVVNSYGISLLFSPLRYRLQAFDAVFTIFGPLYVLHLEGVNITGFAQPSIIYPQSKTAPSVNWIGNWVSRLRFRLQTVFFRRADYLIVELDHVKDGLLRQRIGKLATISVVRNCLASLYSQPICWKPVVVPALETDIRLGFVGRNYTHKNTRIFPAVIDELKQRYGIRASIYVTFTEEEWNNCDETFRRKVINVGPLFVVQCPSFYQQMDAVLFPSLLECFSATPLEAMAMQKPLFASDRPFNRDVCQEHAYYFDPLSAASAAQAIAQVFLAGGPKPDAITAAREHALNFSNPKQRAEKYLSLLMHSASRKFVELKEI